MYICEAQKMSDSVAFPTTRDFTEGGTIGQGTYGFGYYGGDEAGRGY
jgi:hypothetical protein